MDPIERIINAGLAMPRKPSFICALALIFTPLASSQEVKIQCNINLTSRSFIDGSVETARFNEVFEISTLEYLFIIPQGDRLTSISTVHDQRTISVTNLSDSKKWEVQKIYKARGGERVNLRYVIDRNTGKLSYQKDWDNGKISDSANGDCQGVPLEKRRF